MAPVTESFTPVEIRSRLARPVSPLIEPLDRSTIRTLQPLALRTVLAFCPAFGTLLTIRPLKALAIRTLLTLRPLDALTFYPLGSFGALGALALNPRALGSLDALTFNAAGALCSLGALALDAL